MESEVSSDEGGSMGVGEGGKLSEGGREMWQEGRDVSRKNEAKVDRRSKSKDDGEGETEGRVEMVGSASLCWQLWATESHTYTLTAKRIRAKSCANRC